MTALPLAILDLSPVSVGWALLHSLWQLTLIAVVLRVALRWLRERAAHYRYFASCAALLAMTACLPATLAYRAGRPSKSSPSALVNAAPRPVAATLQPGEVVSDGILRYQPADAPTVTDRYVVRVEPFLPWMTGAWLAAGLAFAAWRTLRIGRSQRSLRDIAPLPDELLAHCRRLADAINLAAVRFIGSATLRSPATIGWLRPLVLLPVSLLTELSPTQVQALVAHELAHIRHRDYLVNLLQLAIETVLWYHPAVWWVSGVIRDERERWCDEQASGGPWGVRGYAEAILMLISRRDGIAIAPSAAGGSIAGRLDHLLSRRVGRTRPTGLAGAVILILMGAATSLLAGPALIDYAGELRQRQTFAEADFAAEVWAALDVSTAPNPAFDAAYASALAATAVDAPDTDPRFDEFARAAAAGGDPSVVWRALEPHVTLRHFPNIRSKMPTGWAWGTRSDQSKLVFVLWRRARASTNQSEQEQFARSALMAAAANRGHTQLASLYWLLGTSRFAEASGMDVAEVSRLRRLVSYRSDSRDRRVQALVACRESAAVGDSRGAVAQAGKLLAEAGAEPEFEWEIAVLAASVPPDGAEREDIFARLRRDAAARPLLGRLLDEAYAAPLAENEVVQGLILVGQPQPSPGDRPATLRVGADRRRFR